MTFKEKANKLWEDCRSAIIESVHDKGVPSKFAPTINVIPYTGEMFVAGSLVVEIGEDSIVGEDGYQYDYGNFDHEQLSQLADYVSNT